AVAQNDQQFVAVQRFGIEQRRFVGEVDRDAELLGDGPGETSSDVVGVVIAIADQSERSGFLGAAGDPRQKGRSGHGRQSRAPRRMREDFHFASGDTVYYAGTSLAMGNSGAEFRRVRARWSNGYCGRGRVAFWNGSSLGSQRSNRRKVWIPTLTC